MTIKNMRHILLLTLTLIALNAFGQRKGSKVTVIFFDNQNPNLKVTVDTLLKRKYFNFSEIPIDLFFASSNFHLPYYVPTNGVFKNAAKDKECDMKVYPATVKCYEYDDKKRVVKMTVNGSGTINNFTYKYNDKNQITEINDLGTKFFLVYNHDGTLAELLQSDGVLNKKLVFIYD
ncbi:MAG: hypothetical protein IPP96_17140 [Chitinophagaceae bacterium]|nr:hypothetical protein [Chitinophagaceae bacterium]